MTTPLLIGGATTSPLHTALRIAPPFEAGVVHVRDASRSVSTASQLLSNRDVYIGNNKTEQDKIRRRYKTNQARRKLIPLKDARARAQRVTQAAPPPHSLGLQVIDTIPLTTLLDTLDWSPFFHAWELRGLYPAILEDPKQGEAARDLWADGQKMLGEILDGGLIQAQAVFGLWPAARAGDETVRLDGPDGAEYFEFLRQQSGKVPASLADFIAPEGDHMGLFWVTAGHGLADLVARYEADNDTYNALLAKALADRFAESAAEWLHREVRTRHWGYRATESLEAKDLFAEQYSGIRPAPGYPACPDHRHKQVMHRLLNAGEHIGAELTESCAMQPAASVAGFYFAAPEARYFSVGAIDEEQLKAVAERRGEDVDETTRWLSPLLT
jgi:5-methyltetrahydrofolate--homocysteine methyltransferase